jgi:hypothetical protein
MIDAPASSSICCVRALTVPCVPTGMKAGVSSAPCAVVMRPVRARVALSVAILSNENSLFIPVAILPAEVKARKPARTFVAVSGLCYKFVVPPLVRRKFVSGLRENTHSMRGFFISYNKADRTRTAEENLKRVEEQLKNAE